MEENISVRNFGPIREADVEFGDLTLLVGPQGSGKSLLLELFKLMIDSKPIISTLAKYNYILKKDDAKNIIEDYFGEGLFGLFRQDTAIKRNGKEFGTSELLSTFKKMKSQDSYKEIVFYVPAQRILSIADGRPKNFMEFDISSPYVLRGFSETLRVFVQGGLGNPEVIFPMKNRLKGLTKKNINDSIFHDAKVVLDNTSEQRKMKLKVGDMSLPFMTWSAGQREFMPLLLAIYCLSGPPSSVIHKDNYKWVVIEEPEMGLHTQAIVAVIMEVMELLQLGYKVIISTHSTTLLDFAWAFNYIKQNNPEELVNALRDLLGVRNEVANTNALFQGIQKKSIKTYYSSLLADGAYVKDISSLDACSDQEEIAEWGGLSSFSTRASEIVSKYINR